MRFAAIAGLAMFLAVGILSAQERPTIPDRPAALKALDGEWVMSGDVMGKPVTCRMVAGPTLQGAFTEMHMNDVQVPSEYAARVLIGYDAESKTVSRTGWTVLELSTPSRTELVASQTTRFNSPSPTRAAHFGTRSPTARKQIRGFSSSRHRNRMAHGSTLRATASAIRS